MKVVNFLNIYGNYGGVLSRAEIHRKYVSGELRFIDVIYSKWEFNLLKVGVNSVLDYCYENSFREIEDVIKTFDDVIQSYYSKKSKGK